MYLIRWEMTYSGLGIGGRIHVNGRLVVFVEHPLYGRVVEAFLECIVDGLDHGRVHALWPAHTKRRIGNGLVAQFVERWHGRPALGALAAVGGEQAQLAGIHMRPPSR